MPCSITWVIVGVRDGFTTREAFIIVMELVARSLEPEIEIGRGNYGNDGG